MLGPIAELEKCLSRLPGFGRKSAVRAALSLVRERTLFPTAAHDGAFSAVLRLASD